MPPDDQAEAVPLQPQQAAPALNYSKDEFLAVVTHELRSPLNAIRGWAHVLRQGGTLTPLQLKALDAIDRNTQVQARLVDDLLDSQRILCGDLRLVLSPTCLATVVNQAAETVQPTAMSRQITLEVDHDPALDMVNVDAARLNQALVKLLSNAVKFSANDGKVHARTAHQPPWILIEVRDGGAGLTAEQLPHVFDRFQQPGHAHTRQTGGLGLGLSLASQFMQLHGGYIRAHSAGPGMGSTFTIHLPDRLAEDLPDPSSTVDGESLSGKRMIVVEDDDDAREILELVLQSAHVDLRSFSRSADAYAYLAGTSPAEQPHALISDIAMPDEDGYAFMRKVRALEASSGRPRLLALALTAFARPEDRLKAQQAGFDDHMAKPIDSRAVLRTLAMALGTVRSTAPSF